MTGPLAPFQHGLPAPLLAAAAAVLVPLAGERAGRPLNRLFAIGVGASATTTALVGLAGLGHHGPMILVDPPGAVLLLTAAVVGTASALLAPSYLGSRTGTEAGFLASPGWYHFGFYSFWSALLALPLAGNLGLAWLLLEATTGASALLVASSGRRRALEAGWKYLLLTTLGLTVALLGVILLYSAQGPGGDGLAALGWSTLHTTAARMPQGSVIVAVVLVMGGLAAKIGWAPVHHWLPDAHSEAPAPVSALLSSALLPSAALVAWRVQRSVAQGAGIGTARTLLTGFGLLSLAVAVPFLWQRTPVKRLLAYSSLEHMGVIALGIGLGHPLALTGAVLHVWGHALAKSLGFYATLPILRLQPTAARRPAVGVGRLSRDSGAALGIALFSLSGLPPSPLFFSELFILAGAVEAHLEVVAVVAAVLLALGFIGLANQLLESLLGRPRRAPGESRQRRLRALTGVVTVGLAALSALAPLIPGPWVMRAIAEMRA